MSVKKVFLFASYILSLTSIYMFRDFHNITYLKHLNCKKRAVEIFQLQCFKIWRYSFLAFEMLKKKRTKDKGRIFQSF